MKTKTVKKPETEEIPKTIFERGDVIVSEDRQFRLITNIVRVGASGIWYECMRLTNEDATDVFGQKTTFERGQVFTQPTDIVEKYFHIYELK